METNTHEVHQWSNKPKQRDKNKSFTPPITADNFLKRLMKIPAVISNSTNTKVH